MKEQSKIMKFLELMPETVFIIDGSGTFLHCNKSQEKLTGYRKMELQGKNFRVIFDGKNILDTRKALAGLIALKKNRPFGPEVFTIKRKDKTRIIVEIKGIPFDFKGKKTMLCIARNITEKEKIIETITRSEEKYRKIVSTTIEGFWYVDFSGRILDVNEAACKILGYSRSDLLKMKVTDIEAVENPKEIRQHLARMKRFGSDRFETKHRRRDKTIIDVEVSTTFIRDPQGNEGFFVFCRDITDRKKTEEELKQNENRLKQVVENAKEFIWEVDSKGLYTFASSAIKEILGYTSSEIVGKKHFYDFFAPDVKKDLTKAALRAFAKREPFRNFVNPNMHKNGSTVVLETSGAPFFGSNGKFLGYRGMDIDITKQKKMEEELKKSESSYRYLYEKALTFNIIIEPDGRIIDVNETAAKTMGYTKKDVIGKQTFDFVVPEQRKKVVESFLKGMKGEVTQEFDVDITTKDRSIRTIMFSPGNVKIYRDGKLAGILMTGVDITERKKIENELYMQKVNAEKYLEIAATIVIALDSKGIINEINNSGCEFLGYKKDDLIGRKWIDIAIPPERRKDVQDVFNSLISGKMLVDHYENPVLTKTGVKIVAWKNSILNDSKGNIIGTLSAGNDITEQKTAEEQLKKANWNLKTKISDMEKINKLTIDRELRMIELKKRIRELEKASMQNKQRAEK